MRTLKMLELSTAHVPHNEAATLDKWAQYSNDYGWIIWSGQDDKEFSGDSPILTFILKYARKHNFDYVLFDEGSPTNEDLPVFEWPMEPAKKGGKP